MDGATPSLDQTSHDSNERGFATSVRSLEPTAMLTVSMTWRATGTAIINRTGMSGIISRSGVPRIRDSTSTTPSSKPTMTKSQRTTLPLT